MDDRHTLPSDPEGGWSGERSPARAGCVGGVGGRAQAAAAGRFFYGWFIVGILFVISILDGGLTYVFSVFLRPVSEGFGWTRAETAAAFSLYLLAAGVTLPCGVGSPTFEASDRSFS